MDIQEIISIILLICALAIMLCFDNIKVFFEYLKWRKNHKNYHSYNQETIKKSLFKIAEKGMSLHGDNVPYGRCKWFIVGNRRFARRVNLDLLEFYGFTPFKCKKEPDFKEYGLLLTQYGFFCCCQKKGNSRNEYEIQSRIIPFKGLWNVEYVKKGKEITFYYRERTITIKYEANKEIGSALALAIKELIEKGYTQDIKSGYVENVIQNDIDRVISTNLDNWQKANQIGALYSIYSNVPKHFNNITLNCIVSAKQKHGFAAEYANDLIDKVRHPFKHVERIGQNNVKNGADRIVGNVKIQTKYCATAAESVDSAFENGGMYRYPGMQLEVPKHQGPKAIEEMKKKILEGRVPGVTDCEEASAMIVEGKVTWEEAKLIAKGGNITAIKYETLDGIICTVPSASISFVISFAQARWAGVDNKEAVCFAGKAGALALAKGTLVHAGAQEFAKLLTPHLKKWQKDNVTAAKIGKVGANVITIGIIFTPDIFKAITGKISQSQLLKNSVIGVGSVAGAAAAGAIAGTAVPGVGNVTGVLISTTASIAGSIAGKAAATQITDYFIQDDRIKMFVILKEEYIDAVMSMYMSEVEFQNIQNAIFDDRLEEKLKDIFRARKKGDSRKYAREEIVEKAILDEFSKREVILEDFLEGA